jgi:hypothetical protein
MKTRRTLEEAREMAKTANALTVLEIEHETEGRCYIAARAYRSVVDRYLAEGKLPGVTRIIADYPVTEPVVEPTRCDRCDAVVDPATAYSQQQTTRCGSSKVKYTAHYCDDCARLLQAVGMGEHTAMQERASAQPDMTPETKAD